MIKIKKQGNLITITGHANYSDSDDIVCASVSSIMYTTVNAIMQFDKEAISFKDDGDKVTIEILNENDITDKLIDNMMALYKELEVKYPKNVKIIKEEM